MKLKWMGLSLGLMLLPKVQSAEVSLSDTIQQETPAKVQITYDDPRDPFEGFNRAMWDFNYLYLDRYLYRPVAHGYNDYIPTPAKTGINNFVQNLEEPSSLVNNVLQGKWGWAANAGGRFTINSTVGLLGVIDVADMMGMSRKQDEFNEVLGYYGVPNGPYFMAPFAGPYVVRELASDWVDGLYFPLSELTMWQSIVKWGLKTFILEHQQSIKSDLLIMHSIPMPLSKMHIYSTWTIKSMMVMSLKSKMMMSCSISICRSLSNPIGRT